MACYHAPRRLLWFIIGAGTATWWIKRKDCERTSFGPCRRLPPSSQGFPQDTPTPKAAPPYPYPAPAAHAPLDPAKPADPQAPVVPQQGAAPPAGPRMKFPPPVWEREKREDWEWEQEKENLAKMSNQAADVVRTTPFIS